MNRWGRRFGPRHRRVFDRGYVFVDVRLHKKIEGHRAHAQPFGELVPKLYWTRARRRWHGRHARCRPEKIADRAGRTPENGTATPIDFACDALHRRQLTAADVELE